MSNIINSRLFLPKWDNKPLFFLHIPKTSGSSNNQFLRGVYGIDNFQDHTENLLPNLITQKSDPLNVDCISGHIPLWAWNLYEGAEDYARVTLLRDPWARLVSHINWVNLFNHGVALPRHGPGAADLAQMVASIAQTDFQDRSSLLALFDHAQSLRYFSSFDNYQTRMLRQGAMDAMEKPLKAADLDIACDALSGFFHVGFCEEQQQFQDGLLKKINLSALPQPIKVNTGRNKALMVENSLAAEIFAPWYEKDQALVGFAKGLQKAEFKCKTPPV